MFSIYGVTTSKFPPFDRSCQSIALVLPWCLSGAAKPVHNIAVPSCVTQPCSLHIAQTYLFGSEPTYVPHAVEDMALPSGTKTHTPKRRHTSSE